MDERDGERERALDGREVDDLDAAWDAYLAGAGGWARHVPPALAETVRRLHAGQAVPPATARRIWLAAAGPAWPAGPGTRRARSSRAAGFLPAGAGWLGQALAAALLVATLAGVTAAFLGGSDLPGAEVLGPGLASAEATTTKTAPAGWKPLPGGPARSSLASPALAPTATAVRDAVRPDAGRGAGPPATPSSPWER